MAMASAKASAKRVRHQDDPAATVADDVVGGAEVTQLLSDDFIMEIDKLTELGIAAADITKLKNAGVFTVTGIHMQCHKDLCNIKGLSEAKVDKIIEAARKLSSAGFVNGVQCLQQRKRVAKITTGCSALGEFRTGKTQLAHTLCVTAQLPTSMGGGNGKAIFVDTEATFRPERIRPIAERFGLDPEATLENILIARAYTHEHQAHLIASVAAKMAEDQYSLIVIDSITALFRVDFSGRGELAERQQKLGKMLSTLIKLAEEYNVVVYITNQVVADPGGASIFVADPKKPVGGHILAHASTTRLSMRKGRGDQRICKIYDSPSLPETECVFSISEQGVVDAKE
jgi:meiotic recombination protein DMC1